MNLNQLLNSIKNYKKGTYTKVCYKSTTQIGENTLEKITNGVVRFISYGSVKATTNTNSTPKKSNNQVIVKDICYYNENTKNYLVQMYISKNKKHKSKSTYYLNGVETTKENYEVLVKANKRPIDLMFTKKLQDIITIG